MQLERFNGNIGEADFLNMLMVDIAGNIRSVSLPRGYVSEKVMGEGIGFDASNYGYAKVNNSDMVAVPDMETAFYDSARPLRRRLDGTRAVRPVSA